MTAQLVKATELRIFACSDLHIDFMSAEERDAFSLPDADIYLIAGDTMNGVKLPLCQWVVQKTNGKPTYLIPGNHEYYGLRRDKAMRRLNQYLADTNVHVLLDSHAEIAPGLSVFGTDMWTDMNLHNDVAQASDLAYRKMNDYKAITFKKGPHFSKLRPKNTIHWHVQSKNHIQQYAQNCTGQYILMTHHGLFKECLMLNNSGQIDHGELDPMYTSDAMGFVSTLAIQPSLCINGHMHHKNHTSVAGIPLISNPRGYDGELLNSLIIASKRDDRWTLTMHGSSATNKKGSSVSLL